MRSRLRGLSSRVPVAIVGEQILWSASNATLAVAAGLFLEGSELAFVISAQAAISVAGGIVRAMTLEGRGHGADLARVLPAERATIALGLLTLLAVLGAVHGQELSLVLVAIASGLAYVVAEHNRAGRHHARASGRLVVGSSWWLAATLFSIGFLWITNSSNDASVVLGCWGAGALVAAVVYGRASSTTEARLNTRASAVEYILASGSEQSAIVAGGLVTQAVDLAAVRLASVVLAPINILAIARRTSRFVTTSANDRPARLAPLWVALAVGLALSFGVAAPDLGLWGRLLVALPVALPARLVVAELFASTVKDRHLVGVAWTGVMRAGPSIGLLMGFLFGLSPTWCFAFQATFGLVSLSLFRRRATGRRTDFDSASTSA